MSIDIKAEVTFRFAQEGEYLVHLKDTDRTMIGKVFQWDGEWRAYTTNGQPTGRGNTRYMAARGLLENYELANGLRDSQGRRVGRDPEVLGFWCVLSFEGTRESKRWTDKAEAIAHLASLQRHDLTADQAEPIDTQRCIDNGAHLASSRHIPAACPASEDELGVDDLEAFADGEDDEDELFTVVGETVVEGVPTITPVLVWLDGTVTGGVKELTDRLTGQAYGHETDEFTLYVTQGGELHSASTRQISQTTDADSWIHEQYGVYVGDATESVLTLNLRIDGRA